MRGADVGFYPAEVVAYLARNLEPYRGIPSFMRSLPKLLKARSNAQVLSVGGEEVGYGTRLPKETHLNREFRAMSTGWLVVGSRTAPQVQEVLRHGGIGLLADFLATDEITDRVIEALEDRRAFASLRKNARQTVLDR